jgi:cell division protein FtsW
VAIQTVLNLAVVTNSMPNTGISLPFFSSGGTSLALQIFEMGIVLNLSRETDGRNFIQKGESK